MSRYQLFIETEVFEERANLPGNLRQRIKRVIENFESNPRQAGSEILDVSGLDVPAHLELRRLRLDKYRIVYAINENEKVSSQYFGKFPKFESRAFSCSTQTSEISPGFLKGYEEFDYGTGCK
jgi:mRNA-degrading endonuclease RelE of RelBE toxin-antitoxin system